MFTPEKIAKMRVCLDLLPEPGGRVVGECLDEIDRLRTALEQLADDKGAAYWTAKEVQDIARQALNVENVEG